jgi:hypothetical protein
MTKEQEQFIQRFLSELEEDNVAIFAGAGMSCSAGYVNWRELLRPLAKELNLDIDNEQDLVGVAQFYLNENGRNRISQQLIDEIATAKKPTENHSILARLPIRTYWTTNYDKLIERSLEEQGKVVDVKYTNNHLAVTKKKRDAIIYKMHGDIEHADSAVITKDDYERYPLLKKPYITALSGDLVSKTFLFLGFSFTDPNLDYIMSRVRAYFEEHQRQHYCIFKQCNKDDFPDLPTYENAVIKQGLLIKDLSRFQVKTILVESYSDVTRILRRIERTFRRKTIFLSGSASDFGKFNQADVETFLCQLGKVLIERNYKISSGIGLGIGNAFITGAIQGVYARHNGRINDYLNMKPFPQHIDDITLRNETWSKYRHEIIGSAGIAIFFMGNKLVDGKIVSADGVRKEFEIAHKLGLALIPVGCSGFMAQEIWGEVMSNLPAYYDASNTELISALQKLGESVDKPEQLIEKILTVVDLMSKE